MLLDIIYCRREKSKVKEYLRAALRHRIFASTSLPLFSKLGFNATVYKMLQAEMTPSKRSVWPPLDSRPISGFAER